MTTTRVAKNLPKIFLILFGILAGAFILHAVPTALAATPCPTGATKVASSANLSSIVSNAAAGSTICLTSSADYGKLDLSEVSKSSDVTIMPDQGVTPSLWLWLVDTHHVKIQGVKIAGGYIKYAHNITLYQDTITDQLRVDADPAGNMALLIDSSTFDGVDNSGGYDGRLSILGNNSSTALVNITISNSHFGGGGNTDGVFLSGGVSGVHIGPGNEFEDLHNVGASHTDAIQLYGSSKTVIEGNYLHNNDSGIMAPDGSNNETITNNVVITDGYACPIVMGGAITNTVTHNTLTQGGICVSLANNCSTRSSGNIVKDNLAQITEVTGWNSNGVICPGNTSGFIAVNEHNISGSSSDFVGPLNPGNGLRPVMGAYALKSGPGKGAASDGKDIGINLLADGGGTGGGTTTPTGDFNSDGKANIYDLSMLLSNYGKTKAQASNPAFDLNNNSTIDNPDVQTFIDDYYGK